MDAEMEEETFHDAQSGDPTEEIQKDHISTAEANITVIETTLLGGTASKPCFCLLDGFFDHPETGKKTRMAVPIACLPAVLGRSHDTTDPHFVGLGTAVRALSREQCKIEYRTVKGSLIQQTDSKITFQNDKESIELINPKKQSEEGYYTITCLGKNKITVDGQKLDHEKAAILHSGSTVRISSYCFYFFLPSKGLTKTISLPSSPSKRKAPTNSSSPTQSSKKARGLSDWKLLQSQAETAPTSELLELINEAVTSDAWDRRAQFIGTAVAYRAVRAAASDPEIQAQIRENYGISRGEIMDWIAKSDIFGSWVGLMLRKLEDKSYQASITKALVKAGFERIGSGGRYVKWLAPKDLMDRSTFRNEDKDGASHNADDPAGEKRDENNDNQGNDDDDENTNRSRNEEDNEGRRGDPSENSTEGGEDKEQKGEENIA